MGLKIPPSHNKTWGVDSQCERKNGRNRIKTNRRNIHSPTADSAMVGFLVSLKYKSQKSNAQFICHHPPGAFHPLHFPFSRYLEISGNVRALKRT